MQQERPSYVQNSCWMEERHTRVFCTLEGNMSNSLVQEDHLSIDTIMYSVLRGSVHET